MKETKASIFELYGKVLKGDKPSKKKLREIYLQVFPDEQYPNRSYLVKDLDEDTCHLMFLHLDQVLKA